VPILPLACPSPNVGNHEFQPGFAYPAFGMPQGLCQSCLWLVPGGLANVPFGLPRSRLQMISSNLQTILSQFQAFQAISKHFKAFQSNSKLFHAISKQLKPIGPIMGLAQISSSKKVKCFKQIVLKAWLEIVNNLIEMLICSVQNRFCSRCD
jgi:hypothetical protein